MEINTEHPVRVFLHSYWELKKEQARIYRRIEELTAQAEKMTANVSGMPRGGTGEHNAVWDALADTRTKYSEALVHGLQAEREIEGFLAQIPTTIRRQLLRHVYLEGMSINRAALEIDRSERQAHRIHGRALQEAERLWDRLHKEASA